MKKKKLFKTICAILSVVMVFNSSVTTSLATDTNLSTVDTEMEDIIEETSEIVSSEYKTIDECESDNELASDMISSEDQITEDEDEFSEEISSNDQITEDEFSEEIVSEEISSNDQITECESGDEITIEEEITEDELQSGDEISSENENAEDIHEDIVDNCTSAYILTWPVPGYENILWEYKSGVHNGIDIGINGATVVAALSGTVVRKSTCTGACGMSNTCCRGSGTSLCIKGIDNRYYEYAHMQAGSIPTNITVNSTISSGQIIGKVGSTGNSTGPHLHFQIAHDREWGRYVDPMLETYSSSSENIISFNTYGTEGSRGSLSETNAVLYTVASTTKTSGLKCGLRVGTASNNLSLASKEEDMSSAGYNQISNNGYVEIWYDLNSELNCYLKPGTTYYYQFYMKWNGTEYADAVRSFTVPGGDTEQPTISNVTVTDLTKDGYTVICTVNDNVGVTSVKFPTWIEGTTNAVWYDGTINGNTATIRVLASNFSNESVTLRTDIYAYDDAGNSASYKNIPPQVVDRDAPSISNVNITDLNKDGYTVTCTVNDNVGVTNVKFPTWIETEGSANIVWYDGTINGNTATFRVLASDFSNESVSLQTHIYAYDAMGNSTSYKNIRPQIIVADSTSTHILTWPVPGYEDKISQGYISGQHNGIDIASSGINGATVVAALDGTVVRKSTCTGACDPSNTCCYGSGTSLCIKGIDNRYYEYAHMLADSIPANITVNSTISSGQIIGKVGSTGYSTAPHLHFQIAHGKEWGAFVDPMLETYSSSSEDVISFNTYGTEGSRGSLSETNAVLYTVVSTSKTSGLKCGVRIGIASDNLSLASKEEDMSSTGYNQISNNGHVEIWYDLNSELNCSLKPNTTYYYQFYMKWNGTEYADAVRSFTTPLGEDTEQPTISNVTVTDLTKDGYTVTCTVNDNVGVTSVKFPTWIEGTTNAIWYDGTINGSTATVRVSASDFSNESVTLQTHIYAYDAMDNSVSYKNIPPQFVDRNTESDPETDAELYNLSFATLTCDNTCLRVKKNNAAQTPKNIKVVYNGKKLKKNTDYTISYKKDGQIVSKPTTVGEYTMIVTGKGKYIGTKSITITVTTKKLLSSVTVKVNKLTYTGKPIISGVIKSVKNGKTKLTEGTDYTVTYENNVNSGKGTVILKAVEDSEYAGEKRISFNITGVKMSKVKVTGITSKDFNGIGDVEQDLSKIKLAYKTKILVKGTDYDVSYENNDKAGTARIVFTGKGAYNGTLKKTFKIKKVNLINVQMDNSDITVPLEKGGAKPDVNLTYNGVKLVKGVDYTLSYSNNKSANGKKTPTIKIKGKGNYTGNLKKTFTIVEKN